MWGLSKHSAQAQLESIVLQRTAELQSLSQRLLKVQDEERRKLSRDLHDSTGQTLAALKISVAVLQERCEPIPGVVALASEVAVLADQASQEIRTMSYLLHPPLLDEVGFACAAEWYIEGFAKRSGISVKLDIATTQERLPIGIEVALFRVLQESLTNVHRHSRASGVSVCFRQEIEKIVLEVRDDGRGISADRLDRLREASAEAGVGLAGMRERMNELNGKLEIQSDSHGTTMRAMVPRTAIFSSVRLGDCDPLSASSVPGATAICQADEAMVPREGESSRSRPLNLLATMILERAKQAVWRKQPWNRFAVVVTLLVLACWIIYRDRRPDSSLGSLDLQRTAVIAEQVPPSSGKVVPSEYRSESRTVPLPGRATRAARPYDLVHIGEDVTVRYFTPKPGSHLVPVGQYQIVGMGEDVTVLHFGPIARKTGRSR